MKRLFPIVAAFVLVGLSVRAAGPSVAIVAPPNPHRLERMAIAEVTKQLQGLFDAQVTVVQRPRGQKHMIILGSSTASAMPGTELGPQDHLVGSVKTGQNAALVIAGGTPQATYWAALEFGHHFGVRRLLHADFPPLKKPQFSLAGIHLFRKPVFTDRAWRILGDSPASPVSWSLAEYRLRLQQLAKLKFNHLIIPVKPWQPFAVVKPPGEKKLWQGPELRVDGETAGRAAFGRERTFGNPSFPTGLSDDQRVKHGIKFVRDIIKQAKELGLRTTIEVEASEKDLAAYRKVYPAADAVVAASELATVQIGNTAGNVLPLFDLQHQHAAISDLRQAKERGFAVSCQLIDDLNTSAFYLSRAGFDSGMTPKRAVDELITPISGDVSKRIGIGFDHLAKADALIEEHDPTFATPRPDVIMRHYRTAKAVPAWWGEAKGGFAMAMNEMYRANTRARGGAREFSLYLAKKFEFALHYFTCVESLRAAAIARSQQDKEGQLEGLDKAVEAMHNAMSAIADVDRNNADRGVIALFNEYGFRPLIRELEKADN